MNSSRLLYNKKSSYPSISKSERTSVICFRAEMLSQDCSDSSVLKWPNKTLLETAKWELDSGILGHMAIERTFPDNSKITLCLKDVDVGTAENFWN